jgi:hypothetical protein
MELPEEIAQQQEPGEQERAPQPVNTPSEGDQQPPFEGDIVRTPSVEDEEEGTTPTTRARDRPCVFEDRSPHSITPGLRTSRAVC